MEEAMKRWFVLIIVSALVGCATAPTQTYLADGRQGYLIDCSGSKKSWGICYQQAGELCGISGYEVVAQGDDTGYRAGTTAYGAYTFSTTTRSLMVACKK
jgi:hypothetical protein